jgi:hypothetical protein
LNIPPVMRITFPERSGMSVSGLNFPLENILKINDSQEDKFDDERDREKTGMNSGYNEQPAFAQLHPAYSPLHLQCGRERGRSCVVGVVSESG